MPLDREENAMGASSSGSMVKKSAATISSVGEIALDFLPAE